MDRDLRFFLEQNPYRLDDGPPCMGLSRKQHGRERKNPAKDQGDWNRHPAAGTLDRLIAFGHGGPVDQVFKGFQGLHRPSPQNRYFSRPARVRGGMTWVPPKVLRKL